MPSFFALGTLFGVALLALFPDGTLLPPSARLSEKTALLFLVVTFLVALAPRLQRKLFENRDAATFLLICAAFILFHIAERAGPRDGFSLRFAALPDDTFPVSYALRLAVFGAILSVPAWIRGGGPQKAIGAALLIIAAFGIGSFLLLARFYPTGATEILDPTPLPPLFLQMLGYGAIAALCRAVTQSDAATRLALRAMPLVLFVVWAKMQLIAPVVAPEDAE